MLIRKIESSESRKDVVSARRQSYTQSKAEQAKTRFDSQQTKLQILTHLREESSQSKLSQRERQRTRATSLKAVRRELQQARKQMAKEFVEKKQMIVDKLKELRSQKRSIEEIYKYTTDIILEEEDEDEEEEEELPKP